MGKCHLTGPGGGGYYLSVMLGSVFFLYRSKVGHALLGHGVEEEPTGGIKQLFEED